MFHMLITQDKMSINSEIINAVVSLLEKGAGITAVAKQFDIPRTTVSSWNKYGKCKVRYLFINGPRYIT